MNKYDKKELARNLKPAGSYLDSLSDFADLLGTIRQAESAADKLLEETAPSRPKPTAPGAPVENHVQPHAPAHPAPTKGENQCIGPESPTANPAEQTDAGELGRRNDQVCSSDGEEGLCPAGEDDLLAGLDALVGLENIKQNVRSLINYVKIRKLREEKELPNPPVSLHMVFMGNPGTGKTTVARIISQLYRSVGVLSKGQLVEVDRSGLVAGFVGQTALKTSEVVQKAIGGILFIDEAYSLVPDAGSVNDFGREAIETLLKLMEDNRDDLVVIAAGYTGQMERFIASNPGLESRFNRYFVFEDFSSPELYEIFNSMCSNSEYLLTDDAAAFAHEYFDEIYESRDDNFGNARHVRNYFENIVSVHSDRVSALPEPTRDILTTVLLEDMEKAALL